MIQNNTQWFVNNYILHKQIQYNTKLHYQSHSVVNFEHMSVKCLDCINALWSVWFWISSFFTEYTICHLTQWELVPPPFSPSAKTTGRPLTSRLLQDKTSPDEAWQLTHKSFLIIHRRAFTCLKFSFKFCNAYTFLHCRSNIFLCEFYWWEMPYGKSYHDYCEEKEQDDIVH